MLSIMLTCTYALVVCVGLWLCYSTTERIILFSIGALPSYYDALSVSEVSVFVHICLRFYQPAGPKIA